jgi:hypothetical protein
MCGRLCAEAAAYVLSRCVQGRRLCTEPLCTEPLCAGSAMWVRSAAPTGTPCAEPLCRGAAQSRVCVYQRCRPKLASFCNYEPSPTLIPFLLPLS